MKSGDLVLCHSKGLIGSAIRWAERKMFNNQYAKWNHVGILDRQDQNGNWFVIQAEAKGVTDIHTLDTIAPGGEYEIVPLPAGLDKDKFLKFARAQVGAEYGWLSILSCALDMFLPDSICLRKNETWICSGLVAGALWFAGFTDAMTWPDLYTVTPAEIAQACKAK